MECDDGSHCPNAESDTYWCALCDYNPDIHVTVIRIHVTILFVKLM
jgi:hypothetical protein